MGWGEAIKQQVFGEGDRRRGGVQLSPIHLYTSTEWSGQPIQSSHQEIVLSLQDAPLAWVIVALTMMPWKIESGEDVALYSPRIMTQIGSDQGFMMVSENLGLLRHG